MFSKVWTEITYPFSNFNCCTVEVWEWISDNECNYLPMLAATKSTLWALKKYGWQPQLDICIFCVLLEIPQMIPSEQWSQKTDKLLVSAYRIRLPITILHWFLSLTDRHLTKSFTTKILLAAKISSLLKLLPESRVLVSNLTGGEAFSVIGMTFSKACIHQFKNMFPCTVRI